MKKHSHNFFYWLATILMILGILELFHLLPKNVSFFKSFLGLTFFGYVIYHASVSKILFGIKSRWIDSFSLFGFFFLSLRFILETVESSGIIKILVETMRLSLNDLNVFFFGSVLFLGLSFYCATLKIKKPSFCNVLGELGKSKNFFKYIVRTIIIFVVFLSFYLLIFDLLLEWFTALLDNFIAISLFLGIFGAIIHKSKNISIKRILRRLEVIGKKLGDFIKMFHSRKTLWIAVAGLLILHPISDLIVYFFTYATNIPNFFIEMLPVPTHFPLMARIFEEVPQVGAIYIFPLIWGYIFNLLAMFFLLYTPAHILLKIYNKKKVEFTSKYNSLFFASLASLFMTPAWAIARLNSESLVGVDFITFSIIGTPLIEGFLVSLIVGAIVYYLSEHYNFSKITTSATLLFLGIYILFFFSEIWINLAEIAATFFRSPQGILGGIVFVVFLAVSLIFYFSAFTSYVYEVYKNS